MKKEISKEMTLAEIANNYPGAAELLLGHGLHCVGCHVANWETLEEGLIAHGMSQKDLAKILKELNSLNNEDKKKVTKNLDLRKMAALERHQKIFELWDELKVGEILKITNDHEAKPLYYQFEAEHKGAFKWNYEKQGPKDWIFTIKKLKEELNNKEEIKNFIKQIKSGKNKKDLKKKAKDILRNISPEALGYIEQELIEEGITRQEMRKLCGLHLEVMGENVEKNELDIQSGHPIRTLMEEHTLILGFAEQLKMSIKKIAANKSYSKMDEELKNLINIAKHLLEADKHHQREEEALFPVLKNFGVVEPPTIMKEEHEELRNKEKELYKIVRSHKKMPYTEYVKKIKEISKYLSKELSEHIYKENNILYPMAMAAIPEKKWTGIKKKCDQIGYCCFTPHQ